MFPTIKFSIERWKYNPTFELYVSNMGHIRNKSKADIAPKVMQGGYMVVFVHGSLNKYMLLHRVVMLTWKPTPEAEELTVDHLDHNKRNNALSNLEWVSREENERRAKEDYLNGATADNGKEVTVSEKVVRKAERAAAVETNKEVKHVPGNIDYFHVTVKGTKKMAAFAFTIRRDLSDFDKKSNVLLGRLNCFTTQGFREVLNKMLDGTNPSAAKKWCTLNIRAVYTDGRYNDGGYCLLAKD